VIKRVRLVTRAAHCPPATFASNWPVSVSIGAEAPPGIGPSRLAVGTTIRGETRSAGGAVPRHDGVVLEWYTDADHRRRFDAWSAPRSRREGAPLVDTAAGIVLDVDELVLRGEPWLHEHWLVDEPAFVHMALARRVAGLSAEEFSRLWKEHAGRLGRAGAGPPVVIPDDARGLAYVQNHPVLAHPRGTSPGRDPEYDAVNEVYFADLESLGRRVAWFDHNLGAGADPELVGESWFLVVRVDVVATA
jgi:EthD domain